MSLLRFLVGALLVLGGIAAGLYVGFYLFLFDGVRDIIEVIQADTVDSGKLAWGIVRIPCAGLAGGLTFWVLVLPGIGIATSAPTKRGRW